MIPFSPSNNPIPISQAANMLQHKTRPVLVFFASIFENMNFFKNVVLMKNIFYEILYKKVIIIFNAKSIIHFEPFL